MPAHLPVPPDIRAQMEANGASLEPVKTSPALFRVRLGDLPIANVDMKTHRVEFADVEVGRMWMGLIHYAEMARLLHENRGPSTLGLRNELRASLQLDPLLEQAAKAGFIVREKGGLTQREYSLGHSNFGEVARLMVVRSTSWVSDVAFGSRSQFVIFSFLDAIAGLPPA